MSEEAEDITPIEPEQESEQSDPHAFSEAQQQIINGLLAKERATATRKATQKAKERMATPNQPQEPTTDTGDSSIVELVKAQGEQLQALTGLLQGTIEKQTAAESAKAFAAELEGLQIGETDKALLKIARDASPEVYAAKLAEYRAKDLPPAPKGPGLSSPGGPSAIPNAPDPTSPTSWTRDDIESMKSAGTFRDNLMKARNSMPGGRGGLFKAKR